MQSDTKSVKLESYNTDLNSDTDTDLNFNLDLNLDLNTESDTILSDNLLSDSD